MAKISRERRGPGTCTFCSLTERQICNGENPSQEPPFESAWFPARPENRAGEQSAVGVTVPRESPLVGERHPSFPGHLASHTNRRLPLRLPTSGTGCSMCPTRACGPTGPVGSEHEIKHTATLSRQREIAQVLTYLSRKPLPTQTVSIKCGRLLSEGGLTTLQSSIARAEREAGEAVGQVG